MLAGGTRIGRYEVLSQLGAGGMGLVYRVRDTRLGREVALKVLGEHRLADARSVARFQQEARLIGSVDHPNVLAVHDAGDHQGNPYLVSELLDGKTLRERLSTGPLPTAETLEIAEQITHGLAAAHEKGIVHRDLKPENVFLTHDGRVKILDFGIAKLLTDEPETGVTGPDPVAQTTTGSMPGTLTYMSPEQLRGDAVDARSDLFSLGCVLYEMVAGYRPFGGKTPMETGAAILHHEPLPLPPSTPRPMASLISRCLEKDPDKRCQSARHLVAALESLSTTPPQEKAPTGAAVTGQPRAFGRRRIAVAAAVCAIGVSLAYFIARHRPAVSEASAPLPSIAVLPFTDLSPQNDQSYFSDGIAEELLNALAQVEGLRVSGRTSSFSFRGTKEDVRTIGQKLNVAHVLEGSVRKAGSRVRVSAQLLSVADGFQLWAQTYDRESTDVFAVQDEIARAVVGALRVKLGAGNRAPAKRRTVDPEAYAQYLVGRRFSEHGTPEGFRIAIAAFEKAVALDAGYAAGWAGLAGVLPTAVNDPDATPVRVADSNRRAVAAADKAVALDPALAEAYASRAYVRTTVVWDFAGARADIGRALSLNPGDARAHRLAGVVALALGNLPEAITALRKATDLDPIEFKAWAVLAAAYLADGHLTAARAAQARVVEIAPNRSIRVTSGSIPLIEGRPQEALEIFERAPVKPLRLFGIAIAGRELGRERESQAALDALTTDFPQLASYRIAQVYAWRGDRDRAFQWLDRAYANHDQELWQVKADPLLRKLRGDARYTALLETMHLPTD